MSKFYYQTKTMSMKKLQFFSLLLGLVLGSLAFVACGDDDNDSTNTGGDGGTPSETSIVGLWKGYIKANNPEDMAMCYNHYTYYYFGKDNKFWMVTSFFPDLSQETVEKYVNDALQKGKATTSVDFNGEIIYFSGTYTDNGKEVILKPNETASYNSYNHKWSKTIYRGGDEQASSMPAIAYTLADGKLTLSSNDRSITHFSYHHTLVGTLERAQNVVSPNIPDPDPIIGTWIQDNTPDTVVISRYFSDYGTTQYIVDKKETGSRQNYSGRIVNYDRVESSTNGNYEIADGKLIITYRICNIHYYNGKTQVDNESEDYGYGGEDKLPKDTLNYSINGNKMTMDDTIWTKSE